MAGDAQPKRICSVEGCERVHRARGLCRPHYDEYVSNERRRARYATDPEYRERVKARKRDLRPRYRSRMSERQRERRSDPEYREREYERLRERRRTDAEYRERDRARCREYQRVRYWSDPEYRADMLAKNSLNRGFGQAMC